MHIGETKAKLEEMQLRENKDASTRCFTDKRALADYARHPIKTKISLRAQLFVHDGMFVEEEV